MEHDLCPPYPYTSYGLYSAVSVITGTCTLCARHTIKGDNAVVEPCRSDIMRDQETLNALENVSWLSNGVLPSVMGLVPVSGLSWRGRAR